MKVAFDTSVLVAVLHRAHPHHARAVAWIDAVAEGHATGLITCHALAELWSVLTRLPGAGRISPARHRCSALVVQFFQSSNEISSPKEWVNYRVGIRRAPPRRAGRPGR